MARDYKNTRRKPAKKPVPGWVWMLSGLMIGLLIALLVYLSQQPGMSLSEKRVKPEETAAKKSVTEKIAKPAEKTVQKTVQKTAKPAKDEVVKDKGLLYEFYTVLPESEIVISEQELIKRQSPAAQQKKHAYILQAGSFRQKPEAESLKARLALLGVESSVDKVVVNGDIWHRIRIGPFVSVREINGIRNRLLHNNINSILIRAR